MKSRCAVGACSVVLCAGLLLGACAPADPLEAGTGGRGPATGGAPADSTGGHSASGGSGSGGVMGSGGSTTGSGGTPVSSGGATGSGGMTGGGGTVSAGTGGRVGTGGAPATGGASAGSGGAAGGAGTFAPVATLLGKSCGLAGCHQGGAHVDLRNDAGLRGRLVNVMPNGTATMTACRTRILVAPGSPSTSVLSQVVKAAVSGCTGARMPDNCSTTSTSPRACLTQAQIAVIDGWIMAGAGP